MVKNIVNAIVEQMEKENLLNIEMKEYFTYSIAMIIEKWITIISVFAATGAINGYTTRASSTIRQQKASASTSYDYNGSVSVSSTYSYVDVNTLATGTYTKNNAHYSHCSVEFSAPSNCHSVKIVSSHKVSAFGQIWSTKTSATC